MPAINRVGSEVSSKKSKYCKLVTETGKKRKVRERVRGVIVRSLPDEMWEVQWANGEMESIHPKNLRHEGEPNPGTERVVRRLAIERGDITEEVGEVGATNPSTGTSTIVTEPSQPSQPSQSQESQDSQDNQASQESLALVEYNANSESGHQNSTSVEEGGISAEISVEEESEETLDIELTEDEEVPMGEGFVHDPSLIDQLNGDKYGSRRQEIQQRKEELLGNTTVVGGVTWKVRKDIEPDYFTTEDFLEMGFRSSDTDIDSLPKRCRTRSEIVLGLRFSPRLSPSKKTDKRDEEQYIQRMFEQLYPVNVKSCLKQMNESIKKDQKNTRRKCNKLVSEQEYWIFIGIILLCAVQKTGGVNGVYNSKETDGLVQRIKASQYMSHTRFKYIMSNWMTQFERHMSEEEKETNKWWRVGVLVDGFNKNRSETVAASRIKTLDESMSAFRPQTRKTGNLPNISFILRKPEPLGTELKTVASTTCNGPIIHAEVQEGKMGMTHKPFFNTYGATTSCVLRLAQATKDSGQKHDPIVRNLFYGDSWFASLKTARALSEELDAEFVGPVKNSHRGFPKKYLEDTMKDWPPGSHLLLETTLQDKKYFALGYKYNMKKVLSFILTEGAGHTCPGEPYEAKWLDENNRMTSRLIQRPDVLSNYFSYSNQIDKHNHARQSQLAIEKNVVTQDGYFRLRCTYLGITVTDTWKLYRHGLDESSPNKHISIHSFCNILCKTNLLNDYNANANKYESTPNNPLRVLNKSSSRSQLQFPGEICTETQGPSFSTLGSGSGHGMIQIGNGKYIASTFEAPHKTALCQPTNEYVHAGKGSYTTTRRKRNKCLECQRNTTCHCSVCGLWFCNPTSTGGRNCFYVHQSTYIHRERESEWEALQSKTK